MSTGTALRAVKPGERPERPPVKSLMDAVAGGDYLEILLAQRKEIAETIGDEKGPAKAALHRQLSLIAKEIETLEARAKQEGARHDGSPVDSSFNAEAI